MFHFSGRGFTPDVPTQIRQSTQIDQRTYTTYVDDYDPPKKSKKSRVEEEVQDNKSREEEVKDNTHVQKVSRRTSARILKGKQNISDSTHDLKQKRKRGAILVEDEAVVKDQIPLNKKKKIVAEVKPQEAVPDEKDQVGDDSGQEDDDDFLDDIMPMTNKCNLDIIFKELEKDPKFHDVCNWLKGIEDDAMLSTVEPVVQANVPGFVSTEAVGKLGAGSKLPEFVSPESMGNLQAGTRLPGFVRPESMGNVGAGSKLPEFVPAQTVGCFGAGAKLPGFGSTFRLSSSSPGIVKKRSPVYSQIQKMLRTRTSETETLTPRASLPLGVETMHQEQKQEEVCVDEVLVLDIGSKRKELIEECLVQRDVSRSSDGPLEIEEFEKYLTGDNENEQKNDNDGEDDISNVEGKNSDTEGVENSNSVQKSEAEDYIVNAEVEIENAAIRNSERTNELKTVIQFKRVELKMILSMRKLTLRMPPLETQTKNELKTVIQFKRVELKMILSMRKLTLRIQPLETQKKNEWKTVIQFKRVGMNMIFGMPKLMFGIQKVEIQATQKGLKTATPNPKKRMPTLQPKKKILQQKSKTQKKKKKLKMKTPKQCILQKKRAWL